MYEKQRELLRKHDRTPSATKSDWNSGLHAAGCGWLCPSPLKNAIQPSGCQPTPESKHCLPPVCKLCMRVCVCGRIRLKPLINELKALSRRKKNPNLSSNFSFEKRLQMSAILFHFYVRKEKSKWKYYYLNIYTHNRWKNKLEKGIYFRLKAYARYQ